MENLRETFERGLSKKKTSARQMLIELKISEPVYYDALKANDMKLSNYRKICDYLEIDVNPKHVANENVSNTKMFNDYWNGLFESLSKEIGDLKVENWTLKKQLGKFSPVSLSVAMN
jgi:hypothetical protein